jgi:nucleoside phosphorylase
MSGDDNQYTFGRIKVHNIVIACIPAGHVGAANACNVATNMQRSFPIKFGLMVGIAGGVWSEENDVHLGDVVVSQPKGQFGGVVQYDFGKTERDGSFRRTSSLNQPPKVLLQSLQRLQTKHLIKGNNLKEVLAAMFEKEPDMANVFRHPGAAFDQLFDASYDHEGGPNNCKRCDPSRVPQDWEPRDTPDPRIHYGTIASANQLMRHSPTRDRVAKDLGVIAFEMEAAGLMNHFPCLVIRGICSYADTHKNKRWQGYAAATAAAFTKELLGFIPKQEGVKMQPACESSHILLECYKNRRRTKSVLFLGLSTLT